MAYVAPNSRAVFYKNTGLSPSYENSLYFVSNSMKDQYFTNMTGFDTSRISYQRENRNTIRIETNIINLYNCDYMRFKNDSFENKWFYAFVIAVNYVNNITTEVVYELDPLMTWMGVFKLGECYIERQHTVHDYIGSNICDEGISVGPYVQEGIDYTDGYGRNQCKIRIQYTNPDEINGQMFGGIYTPIRSHDCDDGSEAAEYISEMVEDNLVDNIVNVFMVPSKFAPTTGTETDDYSISKPYSTVAGYVPKNNKLFVYPYKYLEVDNSEGSSKTYKYEYFNTLPDAESTGSCNFRVNGNTCNSVELMLAPKDYNGVTYYDYTNSLTMSSFPTCAWSTDIYQAYLAQKNAFFTHDVAQSAVQGALSGLTGELTHQANPNARASMYQKAATSSLGLTGGAATAGGVVLSSVAGGLLSVGSTIASNMIDNLIQPEAGSRINGMPSNDSMYSTGQKRYTFHKMSITKNYAMMIDDYFTMFGYKIRQVNTPNMNARPHWTYVKTIGCSVMGELPASDGEAIEKIFDHGIRFWNDLSEMGDYSLNNSPY